MTNFNTGNPIGSTDARDLSDNAQNFDNAVNGTGATWTDRLGVKRRTFRGAVGYTGTGTDGAIQSYTSGLVLSGYNVIILYSGEFYRPSASATLPYTTTSTLPDADGNLVSIGDANLRQDLSNNASGSGAALVSMESGPSVEVAVLDRVIRVTSIENLAAATIENSVYIVSSYRGLGIGGGEFLWSASTPKSQHNAIDVIDPARPFPQDFASLSEVTDWISPAIGAGNGCFLRLNKGMVPTTACGIYPDDGIEYRDNGLLDHVLETASDNRFHLLVKSGRYDSFWDNYYSNLSVTFEKGAVFTGVIHVAINRTPGTPLVERPENVSYYGEVSSYDRVGGYNATKVYVESIVVKSDPLAGSQTSRGVHFYLDTRNLKINRIYVEDVSSNGFYAVGIDGETTSKPSNVRIGDIYVKDSNTHGVYLMGTNIGVESIKVDAYGAGSQTTALPLATLGESSALKGVWFNRLNGGFVNYTHVRQGAGTRANASDGVYCDDGYYHIGVVDIAEASDRGVAIDAQVEAPAVTATKIRSVNSNGINVSLRRGSLSVAGNLVSSTAGTNGLFVDTSATLSAQKILLREEGTVAFSMSGTTTAQEITIFQSTGGDKFSGTIGGTLIANFVKCDAGSKGAIGGLYFKDSSGSRIENLKLENVGTATAIYTALHLEDTTDTHIGSCQMINGLGGGLRLVSIDDCSFNGFNVSGYDKNVVISSITRIGFTNCYNHDVNAGGTLTNMSSASAAFFNSSTMHTV